MQIKTETLYFCKNHFEEFKKRFNDAEWEITQIEENPKHDGYPFDCDASVHLGLDCVSDADVRITIQKHGTVKVKIT